MIQQHPPFTHHTPQLLTSRWTHVRKYCKKTFKNIYNKLFFKRMLSRGIRSNIIKRGFKSSSRSNAKVVMALYEDPQAGYPPPSLRDDLPEIQKYPDGQTLPSPDAVDFQPGDLLGSVSGELGLRKFLEDRGHTLVVTSDKDGDGCTFVVVSIYIMHLAYVQHNNNNNNRHVGEGT